MPAFAQGSQPQDGKLLQRFSCLIRISVNLGQPFPVGPLKIWQGGDINQGYSARSGREELRRLVSHYLTHLAEVTLLLTGTELKNLGVPPGPVIRTIKERLLAARLDGEVASKDEELELARTLINQTSG